MYDVFQLPPEAKIEVERLTKQYWSKIADPQGLVRCAQGLRLMTVRTSC